MYKARKPTKEDEKEEKTRASRTSVQRTTQRSTTQNSTSTQPSRMQVAVQGHNYDEPPRSDYSGRASQMQVALPEQRELQPYRSEASRSSTTGVSEYTPRSQLPPALPSIREREPTRYTTPSQQSRLGRPTEPYRGMHSQQALLSYRPPPSTSYRGPQPTSYRDPQPTSSGAPRQVARLSTIREPNAAPIPATRYADRPEGVQTRIIRPGEPHHFGNRADYERGEIHCTLCRCNNPDSHGDAYTMLNSPRGFDIHGQSIDWQEAKKRMLDHHGKDQISHAEEMTAAPHVFDAQTAQMVLQTEEELKWAVRQGHPVNVNTAQNNVNWHNSDGHAKPYLTQEGAKTQFGGGGGFR